MASQDQGGNGAERASRAQDQQGKHVAEGQRHRNKKIG